MRTLESEVWDSVEPKDLWVLDKLLLAKYLGYKVNPVGLDVPEPGEYIVRPCVNGCGFGLGASFKWIEKSSDHLTPGHFWCEKFIGSHYSVDYIDGNQTLCVMGIRYPNDPLHKFSGWLKVNHNVSLPYLLKKLAKKYKYFNVEVIGDKIIEVHYRLNPDFHHPKIGEIEKVIPVWKDDPIFEVSPSMIFIPDPPEESMGLRAGIFVQTKKTP